MAVAAVAAQLHDQTERDIEPRQPPAAHVRFYTATMPPPQLVFVSSFIFYFFLIN